jgi:hypothetical protein
MAAEIIDFDALRVEPYLEGLFRGYLNDPADSDYQRGYLAAALDIYSECLRRGDGDDRIGLLQKQIRVVPDGPNGE